MPKTVRPERRLEIIVATIGVVAALAGAATGGATSYLVQRNQFTEDKASEARVKRAGVYAAYLRAANDGASEADGAYDRLAAQCRGPSRCSGVTLARGRELAKARVAYQGALNDVYVYGTDEAWRLTKRLSATMPPTLGFQTLQIKRVNRAAFASAYSAFLARICDEVPARPRPGCR
jgi:hypothetical protein